MSPQTIERYLNVHRRAKDPGSAPAEKAVAERVLSKMEDAHPGIRAAAGLEQGFTGSAPPRPTSRPQNGHAPPQREAEAFWEGLLERAAAKIRATGAALRDRISAAGLIADTTDITTSYREGTRMRPGRLRITVTIEDPELDRLLAVCEDPIVLSLVAEALGREVSADFTLAMAEFLDE